MTECKAINMDPNMHRTQGGQNGIFEKVLLHYGEFSKNTCPTLVLKEPIRVLIIGKGSKQNIDVLLYICVWLECCLQPLKRI